MTAVTVDTVAAVANYIDTLGRQHRIYAARVAAFMETPGAQIDDAPRRAEDRAGVGLIDAREIRKAIATIYTLTRDRASQPAEPAESYGPRLTTPELRAELARLGAREYNTLAGWQPLATFDPYGMAPATDTQPAGVNWRPGMTEYRGRIGTIDGRPVAVVDAPERLAPGFYLGRFPVR